MIEKTRSWLLGSKDNPQQYIQHAVQLIVSVAFLYAAAINYVTGASGYLNISIQLAMSVGTLGVWYRSRWHNDYQRMAVTFMVMITTITLPINWFLNGGSYGPTFFLNICVFMYISVAFRNNPPYRYFGQFFSVFVPIPLVTIEYCFPELISPYTDNETRLIDLASTSVVTSIFMLLMMENQTKKFLLRQSKVEQLSEQLRQLSEQDALTGLLNRRSFVNSFVEWKETKEYFTIAAVDIDFFKQVNDQWGHQYGDEVLIKASTLLAEISKENNALAFRTGGEEFMLMMPYSLNEAYQHIQILHDRFAEMKLLNGPVTFSSGLAEVKQDESQDQFLKRVDRLLYQAKNQGRNRTVVE